ncbi:hypothetical protein SKAU_G00240400 [Synaphobranchus kaupii]|uniref:Fibronectin type-III domain-containing protein n=1 Tax=Synaphobranchus kaupii TaxID=118154 RepID=A0A9Q1F7G0_SYNKA|nr:hypothetical protein SKAU_G00240400 [Synaphobranchus kaupii]
MFLKYLIGLLFLTRRGVLTLLSPPVNVTVKSVNLQSELCWSPVTNDENVEYTVQYRVNRKSSNGSSKESSDHDDWLEITECEATRARRCNLTSVIDVFINVTLRVRARDGTRTSPWSQSSPFKAIDQTRLGPPIVKLWPIPETGKLEVRMRDPFHRNDFTHDLKYRVYYKKEDSDWMMYEDTVSTVLIDKFEVGLNYCVKVHYIWRSKLRPNSVPSTPKCAIISESETARSIRITWITASLIGLLIGVLLLVCICTGTGNYDKLKQALQAPLRIPEHLREFLSGEEGSSTSNSSSNEEPIERISLVTIDKEVAEEELSSTPGHT